MNKKQKSLLSKWAKNFVVFLLGAAIGLAIVELALRYLGWFGYVPYELKSFGFYLAPNKEFHWAQPCYSISKLHTNNFVLRQINDVSLQKKKFRIALIGDSFTEANQVTDNENFSALLQEILGPKVEILNFGVSSYGTVQELAQYYKFVRQFRPDVCIIFFLLRNDVKNNHPKLEQAPLRSFLVKKAGNGRSNIHLPKKESCIIIGPPKFTAGYAPTLKHTMQFTERFSGGGFAKNSLKPTKT